MVNRCYRELFMKNKIHTYALALYVAFFTAIAPCALSATEDILTILQKSNETTTPEQFLNTIKEFSQYKGTNPSFSGIIQKAPSIPFIEEKNKNFVYGLWIIKTLSFWEKLDYEDVFKQLEKNIDEYIKKDSHENTDKIFNLISKTFGEINGVFFTKGNIYWALQKHDSKMNISYTYPEITNSLLDYFNTLKNGYFNQNLKYPSAANINPCDFNVEQQAPFLEFIKKYNTTENQKLSIENFKNAIDTCIKKVEASIQKLDFDTLITKTIKTLLEKELHVFENDINGVINQKQLSDLDAQIELLTLMKETFEEKQKRFSQAFSEFTAEEKTRWPQLQNFIVTFKQTYAQKVINLIQETSNQITEPRSNIGKQIYAMHIKRQELIKKLFEDKTLSKEDRNFTKINTDNLNIFITELESFIDQIITKKIKFENNEASKKWTEFIKDNGLDLINEQDAKTLLNDFSQNNIENVIEKTLSLFDCFDKNTISAFTKRKILNKLNNGGWFKLIKPSLTNILQSVYKKLPWIIGGIAITALLYYQIKRPTPFFSLFRFLRPSKQQSFRKNPLINESIAFNLLILSALLN